MKLQRAILICLGVVVCTMRVHSQWVLMRSDAEELISKGSDFIYNTQFDSASSCFTRVQQMYPDHPAGFFLDAMVDWWRMQLDHRDELYADAFLAKVDRVLEMCDRRLDTNESDLVGLFFKGGILGYRGRYYASHQSWLKAANDGREAFDVLLQCNKIAPSNHDIMLGTGIYNYFAAALPEQFPALKAVMLFLPNGDKKLGILQLEAASRSARYAKIEAMVVLQQVYSNQFERNISDYLRISESLYRSYPLNAYFHRKFASALVQVGQNDSSEVHWRSILDKYRSKDFGYDAIAAREALYYIGWYLFNRSKFEEALPYFYKCDEACRLLGEGPTGYMVKLNLYIGKIYDLQGKRDLALSQYQKVLDWKDIQNSHEEAKTYVKAPYGK